jgi:hypothetical protein
MNELWTCYVLLYYSEGCNICGLVLRECYINDWHTTTCSGMQGHHSWYQSKSFDLRLEPSKWDQTLGVK